MKYSDYDRSTANKIVIVVIVIIAIIAIGAFAKVMIDHLAGGKTLTGSEAACENEQAMQDIEKSGIYNGDRPECKKNEENEE